MIECIRKPSLHTSKSTLYIHTSAAVLLSFFVHSIVRTMRLSPALGAVSLPPPLPPAPSLSAAAGSLRVPPAAARARAELSLPDEQENCGSVGGG